MKFIYLLFIALTFTSCYKGIDDINEPIPPIEENNSYIFPDDFTSTLLESINGKEVIISNPLYVIQTFNGSKLSGDVVLSSEIQRWFTDVNSASTTEYPKWTNKHLKDRVIVKSNYSLLDKDKTLRIGTKFSEVRGVISYGYDGYTLTLTQTPKIEYNSRYTVPTVNEHNLKVMSFNLENYYMYGNLNDAKSKRHHAKILSALLQASADVYALCEVGKGDFTIDYLCKAMNESVGEDRYSELHKKGDTDNYQQTCMFIYNKKSVTPHKNFKSYSFDNLYNRYAVQCFQLNSNGAKVIITMSHLKSKSGDNAYGDNVDKNDGQSQFNSRRVSEARECVETFNSLKTYYGDQDVLVLGDLNSYSMEDPIKVYTSAGYENQLKKYSPNGWSYSYKGEVGYIDHSLSSSTLSSQVVHATAWDINASEPIAYRYDYATYFSNDSFGSSDHNPIITWMNLK